MAFIVGGGILLLVFNMVEGWRRGIRVNERRRLHFGWCQILRWGGRFCDKRMFRVRLP